MIEKLSEMFPNETILVGYADEDFGSNLGVYKALDGEMVEKDDMTERTPLAYRFVEALKQISYSDHLTEYIDSIRNVLKEDDLSEKEIKAIQSEHEEISFELSTYQEDMNELKKDHSAFYQMLSLILLSLFKQS